MVIENVKFTDVYLVPEAEPISIRSHVPVVGEGIRRNREQELKSSNRERYQVILHNSGVNL